ncbi:SCHIP1 family protein [Megaselia abdita]
MRVIEPTGLFSTLQTQPPPQSSPTTSSVTVNSRKLNLNLYPVRSELYLKESGGEIQSAAEETIHLTTPSGQILNSIFTESGTGNGNLLNANELHILNSLSKKSNCNGNYSIEDDKVQSNENLKFEYNNQFNEYFFQSEDEEYNLDFPYDKEHDEDGGDVNVEHKNDDEDYDDDNDDSIIKRPISSCSTNSNSTKSINESLMEDDDYLSSSIYSSNSDLNDSSNKRPNDAFVLNYPRGIINPNYPGFQHLAHTLTEHFVSTHRRSHSQDSLDTLDSFNLDYDMELNYDEEDSAFNERKDEFNNNNEEEGVEDKKTVVIPKQYSPDKSYFDALLELEDLSCDLETYLKKYETTADVKLQAMEKEYETYNGHLSDCSDECSESGDEKGGGRGKCQPTPDILIKNKVVNQQETSSSSNLNYTILQPIDSTKNKPDLLQNVNGNEKQQKIPLKQEIQFNDGELKSMSDFCRDDISLGVTPVDIVGDFGREVEREFGLLVSGYKMISDNDREGESIPCDLVLAATSSKLKSKKENIAENLATLKNKQQIIDETKVFRKYQKCAFDDRQLPPVGIHYENDEELNNLNLKKEKILSLVKNKKLSVPPPPPPRRNKRTNYTERSTQILGAVNQRSTDTFRFEYVHHIPDHTEGDSLSIDNSTNEKSPRVVAVVTPRKKDKHYDKRNKFLEMSSSSFNNNCRTNDTNSSNTSSDSINNNKFGGNSESSSCFDVYNIETALPVIDMEAIEAHLEKAKEEEKKRRNDREEIRRRLAMGAEDDYFSKIVNPDNRPIRKPSLQSRIKSGKNLQICFVNETQSDTESVSSDSESCPTLSRLPRGSSINQIKKLQAANPYSSRPLSVSCTETDGKNSKFTNEETDNDFFTKQARLQIEARMALAQAKDMAHMQMEIEKQKQNLSPVTEIIQGSMKKVGVPLPQQKRRVSRQTLTDLNVAQLQVIVNELHSQIESFNTNLVQLLMDRDDLHMGQDAMLVDIEDLTRYLSAKEQTLENDKFMNTKTKALNNTRKVHTQSKLQKFANLVKK